MPRHPLHLRKTTGLLEPFREQKLRRSLARSGAAQDQVDAVVAEVRRRLHEGMTTREVFRIAHRLLRHERRDVAARYSLQRAIARLGPDGFPFEKFVAELWRREGWRVQTGVVLQGRFVRHEIDVVAVRGGERMLAECKFKNQRDAKVDVKVAMYVHARAEDLGAGGRGQFWLVTNGRFSRDAVVYGEGVGLGLLGWDHPRGDGLRERIDRAGLHPVTVLTSLRAAEQAELLRRGVVLCAQLMERRRRGVGLGVGLAGLSGLSGLSGAREARLWEEVEGVCRGRG